MDEKALSRVITRMAHEIVERNKGGENIVFVGMQTRGVIIAKRIAEKISSLENLNVPVGTLDITLYRDDFRSSLKQPAIKTTDIPFSIQEKDLILVDDVLYTGRTVRAALDALTDFGRARTIQLAVLVDRGCRELPIHADYIGKSYSTPDREEIAVNVSEIDKKNSVFLVEVKK